MLKTGLELSICFVVVEHEISICDTRGAVELMANLLEVQGYLRFVISCSIVSFMC
jgi:hypothetical protein